MYVSNTGGSTKLNGITLVVDIYWQVPDGPQTSQTQISYGLVPEVTELIVTCIGIFLTITVYFTKFSYESFIIYTINEITMLNIIYGHNRCK